MRCCLLLLIAVCCLLFVVADCCLLMRAIRCCSLSLRGVRYALLRAVVYCVLLVVGVTS